MVKLVDEHLYCPTEKPKIAQSTKRTVDPHPRHIVDPQATRSREVLNLMVLLTGC